MLRNFPGAFESGIVTKAILKLLLLSIGFCLPGICCGDANQAISREYQLKTAYLFHFAELAQWPDSTQMTICVQGDSPLRFYLPALEGMEVDNKIVHILLDPVFAIDQCQILFLSELDALSEAMLTQAKIHHVLLVSDVEQFASKGGMIQFTLRDNKLKLIVNLASVRAANLRLSSKLLRMAEILE